MILTPSRDTLEHRGGLQTLTFFIAFFDQPSGYYNMDFGYLDTVLQCLYFPMFTLSSM
jgi:hypothetical protein